MGELVLVFNGIVCWLCGYYLPGPTMEAQAFFGFCFVLIHVAVVVSVWKETDW